MDPASILGLTGAVIKISDVIARSLLSLIKLQSKCRTASLVITLLIGQLTTLKAAINQITEWISNSLINIPVHEQLVSDLQVSLESCQVLILVLEERIKGLEKEQNEEGEINLKGKLGFLMEEGGLQEFTNHLNNQANALNLLTAFQCRTTFERNEFLRDDESRRIIKRLADDRTSILSMRNADSQNRRVGIATDNWSFFEQNFDFDQEVLTSDVYRAALRSNMKQAAGTWQGEGKISPLSDASMSEADVAEAGDASILPFNDDGQPMLPPHLQLTNRRMETLSSSNTSASGREPTRIIIGQHQRSDKEGRKTPLRLDAEERATNEDTSVTTKELLNPIVVNDRRSVSSKVTPKTSIKWNLRISKLFSNISGSKIPKDALSLPRGDEAQLPKPDKNQKILLLGISESGKSTLLKSINLLFQGSFTSWERDMYKRTIFSNMVQGMKILLKTMEDREIPFDDQQAECYAKTIFMQPAEIEEGQLSEEVRLAIEVLWKDRGVRDAFEKTRDFQLSDAAAHYFNSMNRLADPTYSPTEFDILMSRIKTTGITEMCFKLPLGASQLSSNGHVACIFDLGGLRRDLKLWIHCFENVKAIVFTVDIASYDLVLYEDEDANRIQESLTLFDAILNSSWFLHTQFILLFTKMDKLKEKLKRSQITDYFEDFKGDADSVEDVKGYMKERFLSLDKKDRDKPVQVLFTSIMDGNFAPAMLLRDILNWYINPRDFTEIL